MTNVISLDQYREDRAQRNELRYLRMAFDVALQNFLVGRLSGYMLQTHRDRLMALNEMVEKRNIS